MRQLVVSCDGTWNTPEQNAVTNVFRLHRALHDRDAQGNDQVTLYQRGVGAEGGLIPWLWGGIAGVGLSTNIMDAYQWLARAYAPGDRIWLFGFSRGAYIARSLAGMVAACGLLDVRGLDDATIRERVAHVYDHRYRAGDEADPGWRDGLRFRFDPDDAEALPVHFIGVWDTVGSLGLPDNLGLLNLLDSPDRYAFHDVTLNPHVRHARQALAMDEHRGPFTPSIWERVRPDQDAKQVWFPGSHMDVGGGHPETGLSDIALRWMIEEAHDAGLDFDQDVLKTDIDPDHRGMLHEDDRASARWLGPLFDPVVGPLTQPFFETVPRAVPKIDPDARDRSVHDSVYDRQRDRILVAPPYRPTTVLTTDRPTATVEVFARLPWNDTGLYLEPGDYTFGAEGEWQDRRVWSGPEGTTGLSRFNPVREGARLLGSALGAVEGAVRTVTRNPEANLIGSRRDEDLPWMSLVGVVANEYGPKPADDRRRRPHQRIPIGEEAEGAVTVTRGGYLYAYANDAWGFYVNNRGSVRLTVTRLS